MKDKECSCFPFGWKVIITKDQGKNFNITMQWICAGSLDVGNFASLPWINKRCHYLKIVYDNKRHIGLFWKVKFQWYFFPVGSKSKCLIISEQPSKVGSYWYCNSH